MKKLLIFLFLFVTLQGSAQTIIKDKQGNYTQVKKEAVKPKETGKTFTDSKGNVYPILISKNGKLFYVRTSKNGNKYNVYLKED